MAAITVQALVHRERESAMRAGHMLANCAKVYQRAAETGTAESPVAAANMSRRCVEATQTITLALRAFGMTDEEIMALAETIDREQTMLDVLRDGS